MFFRWISLAHVGLKTKQVIRYSHHQNYWRITTFSTILHNPSKQRSTILVFRVLPQIMTKLTIQKSGHPIKHKTSPSTRSDTDSTSNSFPKHVKKVNNGVPKNTKAVYTVDDDSDLETPAPAPEPVKDVSDEIFVLQKSCMLGTKAVIEDSDFVRLGEFSFRQFETSAIRKLTKASEEAKTTFE